jgi:putative flippase GtrA
VTLLTLIFRYAYFALIATAANLGAQRVVLFYGDTPLVLAIAILSGTAVGLGLKFALDKRWIFLDHSKGVKAHVNKFALYATTGVITTIIFWTAEVLFWSIWHTNLMRECGAVLGLSLGYVTKFNLDRRFVFQPQLKATR